MIEREYYVYFMTNVGNTVLYVGVTNDLERRVYEHKNSINKKSFTTKYKCKKLVYYEIYNDIYNAISREKQIKSGSRNKKNNLINKVNLNWEDLSENF